MWLLHLQPALSDPLGLLFTVNVFLLILAVELLLRQMLLQGPNVTKFTLNNQQRIEIRRNKCSNSSFSFRL